MISKLNYFVNRMDQLPLWWAGLLMAGLVFVPLFTLGEQCVFPIHDQLDETILSYVFNAKYLGTRVNQFPEILGGINSSGMQPSAVVFVPLYRLFSVRTAFLLQYGIVFLTAFFGMYLSVRELTDSNLLALATAGCFCMLPLQPVYGLSAVGVPLIFYCFLNLVKKKRLFLTFLMILLFGLSTHLVLIGYAVLGIWAFAIMIQFLKKKAGGWVCLGWVWLTAIYVIVNRKLFAELIFGNGNYVSHRVEQVNSAMDFGQAVRDLFLYGTQHTNSLHKYLILPILMLLLLGGFFYRKLDEESKKRYRLALMGMGMLIATALFYGLCKWSPVVAWKNEVEGFLHYFQADRVYWIAPALWFLEFGLVVSLGWKNRNFFLTRQPLLRLLLVGLVMLPTLQEIKINSYLYMNVNQYHNGSAITGYITWESFYAEDLMKELEKAIGRDRESYRVACLGISPAPVLMHGFYTIDGYSNNYPLEYKHSFRKIIEKELEKAPETAVYFDEWGSRCYLFNAETGTAWMIGKKVQPVYQNLELQVDAMKDLGCKYLFSCGVIENAGEMGLTLMGYYETETSYWGVWLYRL